MSGLEEWTEAVRAALELTETVDGEQDFVLDVARDVAHGVVRPAAPVAAYLLGVAVGRGADPRSAAETITKLAGEWTG